MPYYFAKNLNEQTSDSIENTVHSLARVLLLAMTAMEKILVFMVNMYKSLLLCFIELLVRGSLVLLISAVDAFSNAINDAAKAISVSIQGSINAINSSLRTSLGSLNDFAKLFNKSFTIPQVPLPSLNELQNIRLPSEIDGGLRKLNDSLPTLNDLKQKMDELIQIPFEKMKLEVNSTLAQYQFDRSVLPIPTQTQLSFCQDSLDLTPVDNLANKIHHAAKVGVGILVIFALLVITFYMIWQWIEYKSLQKHVQRTIIAFKSGHDEKDSSFAVMTEDQASLFKMMSFLQLSQHAFLASIFLPRAHRIGIRRTDGINRLRWWLAWISHPISMAILAMGIVGLIGVLIQIAAIKITTDHIKGETIAMLDDNAAQLQEAVNDHLSFISQDFAKRSNAIIQDAQNELNNGLLKWVGITTSTMNSTLNEFMDEIANVVNVTFANTPLFIPVQSFVGCVIGQKVNGIEKALTWIHDNAHVTFPLLNETMLILNNSTIQEAIQPVQNGFAGEENSQSGLLQSISEVYLTHLRKQRTMFLILILIYFILFIIGTILAIFHGKTTNVRSFCSPRSRGFSMSMTNRNIDQERSHFSTPSELDQIVPQQQLATYHNNTTTTNRGHQSISRPLLPDVVSLHSQRELNDERERYDRFIKSHSKSSGASSSNIRTIPSYPIEILTNSEHNSINSSKIAISDKRKSPIYSFERTRHGSVLPGIGYRGFPRILSEEEKSINSSSSYKIFGEVLPYKKSSKFDQLRSPTFPSDSTATYDTYVNSHDLKGGAIIFDGAKQNNKVKTTFGIHHDVHFQDVPLCRYSKSSDPGGTSGMAF
ncbi:hypothetical protein L7F22_019139 [Adiantum nelumboides]|nr:hypothetical protein [Adiantum nelumboides]